MATRSAGVLALLLMTAFAFAARPVVDVAKRGQNVLAVLGRGQTEASFSNFFGGLKRTVIFPFRSAMLTSFEKKKKNRERLCTDGQGGVG